MSDAEMSAFLERIRAPIETTVQRLPAHAAYLREYCGALPRAAG
jgi:hypothetical protein